jgi:xanthosine utilization system XapX-like protein
MILIILLVLLPYVQLGYSYGNISLFSMAAALIIGFVFYLCDPDSEKCIKYRIPSIIFLVGVIGFSTFYVFFKSKPELLDIR